MYVGRNGVDRKLWRNELMLLPRLSAAWEVDRRTIVRGGYGLYFDTLNVMNQAADQYGFSRTTSTTLTNDFGVNWLVGDPRNGISPLTDPFPVRSDGSRFDAPLRDALGSMARVGAGYTFSEFERRHPRVQRWRIGVQRELSTNMLVEISYWGQRADRINITQRLDALPGRYWATGNARNNPIASELNRQVPNPFHISNFESLRTSDPTLYQHLTTLPQFTSSTIAKNRLLRPFPHMNGLNNSASAKGKSRTDALEVNFQRRMSGGLNFNASYTRMRQDDFTIFENEFDAAPSVWWPGNNARPHRLTVTGIYELPFGKGRALAQSGIVNHLLGGWQIAFTYEFQSGPLLGWGNIFYYGDINTFEADATSGEKTLERWFNTNLQFERNSSLQPAAFHVRVFPRFFNGLRADGLSQWNANLVRDFRITERLRFQIRGDALNLQNRSQMSPPDLSPTSTNFGRITSQTSSLNRFYQVQARIQF